MPRPPADQPLLTPERIVAAALRMIDQDGVEALSTRKLAAALGVSSKAVYHYYATKDELLHAVYLAILDELELPAETADSWQDGLRRLAHSFRRLAQRHPSFITDFLRPHEPAARELDVTDALYTLLRQAGLPERLVLQTGRILITFLIGYLRAELDGTFSREALQRQRTVAAQHPARYRSIPHLPMPDTGSDEDFDLALNLILAGLGAGTTEPGRP
ncbi:transcriptional regulator, TetR family [Deinococcus aerius]|uniref:Transcriptional regulator, TetR family n=1 Tax=Deinococcus aerius TaxID=200253 RepID=A0A2I9D9R0_9DEIO|nr:TetR/AcrR family transcriptional regulator C-terminal domain-containing protein [Deinococcus aerius]GBF07340.1 transcriptional regulator, TetR family [Deinococcus aerius]